MAGVIRIETQLIHDLPEYNQELHENYISTFEYKLEEELDYKIPGFYNIDVQVTYDPIISKFKLKSCSNNFKHIIEQSIEMNLKYFI